MAKTTKSTKKSAKKPSKFGNFLSKLSPNTPKKKFLTFALVFAIAGGGYYAYSSFAATSFAGKCSMIFSPSGVKKGQVSAQTLKITNTGTKTIDPKFTVIQQWYNKGFAGASTSFDLGSDNPGKIKPGQTKSVGLGGQSINVDYYDAVKETAVSSSGKIKCAATLKKI